MRCEATIAGFEQQDTDTQNDRAAAGIDKEWYHVDKHNYIY